MTSWRVEFQICVFLKTSKSEDTQLLIFREFIDILENIGKVHVWRYGTFKTTFNFFPWRKCFCVFPVTSISILKERSHNRVSKAGIAVFHNYVCWIVAMLCKRKVKKNDSFGTHLVLRKVWCAVTGEIWIYIGREGEGRHNYQRAGFSLAVCVCRPPFFSALPFPWWQDALQGHLPLTAVTDARTRFQRARPLKHR